MLFFPVFLSGELFRPGQLERGVVPLIAFCIASSSTYLINDIHDRERDIGHPRKRHRPIASGEVSVPAALAVAIVLLSGSIAISLKISIIFSLYIVGYLTVSFLYTYWLKNVPIFDIFCISTGFLIRLLAGGVIFAIPVTDWLFLSVFLLAVFLSTGKRLSEKLTLGSGADDHRRTLGLYPNGFLEGVMFMTGGAVLVTYTLYVITQRALVYTVPLCCLGLMRFIFRVKAGEGGDPTESLLKDVPLLLVSLAWAGIIGWRLYF